jgi:hypothetical protein
LVTRHKHIVTLVNVAPQRVDLEGLIPSTPFDGGLVGFGFGRCQRGYHLAMAGKQDGLNAVEKRDVLVASNNAPIELRETDDGNRS